jgi:hypothetical protein
LVHPEKGRTQHADWHYGFDRVLAMIQDTLWPSVNGDPS